MLTKPDLVGEGKQTPDLMKCKQTVAGLTRKKQTGLKAFSPSPPRGNPTSTVEQMCRNSLRLQTFRFDCDVMDSSSVNCVRVFSL